ncbi:hypothetical protein DICPUDRAFT_76252 [Dictyostelium purpureum]|uniref:Tc1-like transposase DDE domain-containing protein n=1 Tax=Dictyostelium purpureum TaxID=5786 RepID=F0ZD23_DICPU|nr:uncharacterized protein DICPUDRAFT_76252 [Dictyostelium purpureum]EGC38167.1 hypothetical protein DICPUDRAFT_76252 [Dictyostelium purpureum]|eukprot:XP_003285294.1 hypothetical protein DICPUDRAFT_76252 [Dictyostelium purpureum]
MKLIFLKSLFFKITALSINQLLLKNILQYEENNIRVQFIPPSSPDLNIIENLWPILKKSIVQRRIAKPRKPFDESIHLFWFNIEQSILNKLNESISTGINRIIQNREELSLTGVRSESELGLRVKKLRLHRQLGSIGDSFCLFILCMN